MNSSPKVWCEGAWQSSYNSLASPTSRGITTRSSVQQQQRGVLTDIHFAIIWQVVLHHSVKGQQFNLSLLSLGCLMLRDGPTARAANALTGTRSSSLASFPHPLGHAYKEAWWPVSAWDRPLPLQANSPSFLQCCATVSAHQKAGTHTSLMSKASTSGDPGTQDPHHLQHHQTSTLAMLLLRP